MKCVYMWVFGVLSILSIVHLGLPIKTTEKDGKLLSIFSVVSFPNTFCVGNNNRNGTCYTEAECTARGGVASGSCAGGYGVCCVITLSCGGMSSDNCTYLVQNQFSAATALTMNPCMYTLCRNSEHICRIRLDFQNLMLAPPASAEVKDLPADADQTLGSALGDCTTDMFTYKSPGNPGAPVICGTNTGQHMILDASEMCNMVSINIGASSMATRAWTIKATQYECGSESAGPPDCLQYFTGMMGVVSSFNYETSSNEVSKKAQHLSNQCYSVCFRREKGKCSICFSPVSDDTDKKNPSFGLSVSPDAADAKSGIDSQCTSDYLMITNGVKMTDAEVTKGNNKFCGRIWGGKDAAQSTTICSFATPFKLVFKTDADEETLLTTPDKNELAKSPGGTTGFSLFFEEKPCA